MKTFEIYIQDLVEEKQRELIEILDGENGNYDVFPIVTLEFEDEEGETAGANSKKQYQ